ncbi:MAG: ion transporter [Gammaproteobacteria bacterium]
MYSECQNVSCRVVSSRRFEALVVAVILLNAGVIAMETYEFWLHEYGQLFLVLNRFILFVFIVEILLKWTALGRKFPHFFRDPWNCFDFCVVALSLLPTDSSEMVTLTRLVRLLRVLRVVSVFPDLRLIVETLVRTLPSMGHISLLLVLVFFVYGVAGHQLFAQTDPIHWNSLHISMLTLFRIVTLEDWTDIMYAAMVDKPWCWIYFVSFVVLGTFVVVNLFIAVVVNNLNLAQEEKLRQLAPQNTLSHLMDELTSTQLSLERLQVQIRRLQELQERQESAILPSSKTMVAASPEVRAESVKSGSRLMS